MKIYVVGAHKNNFFEADEIRERFYIDEPHEGDNIDSLNSWYCEMTGLYYLWKHCDDDIVGLEHYRRSFRYKRNLLGKEDIQECLSNADIICTKAKYSKQNPVKSWLILHNKMKDMKKFLTFAKLYVGEEYYNECWKHLNGDWHCLGNMFICKKELINEYCEFIFDVTMKYKEAEEFYGRSLPPRILGYFTEFLFGAWLTWKNKNICWREKRIHF